MNNLLTHINRRILIIDDNRAIHDDFRKVLVGKTEQGEERLRQREQLLFGESNDSNGEAFSEDNHYHLDFAFQGSDGLHMIERSVAQDEPYAMAFIDVRMPPGWDGIETTRRIWEIDPEIQVVICSAYSDYSMEHLFEGLGKTDRLVILKKPFDNIEVMQLANSLTEKWTLMQRAKLKMAELEEIAETRAVELKKTNRDLQAEIKRHQATEKKLEEARRLAEAAMEARSAFLANISHEIRTPLNGIMGMSELMIETALNTEQQEYINSIKDSSENLLHIINDILDLSKIDAGKLSIEHIRFELDAVLKSVVYIQNRMARNKRLGFYTRLPDDIPVALIGDPNRIKQILVNLLSNAIKFTESGAVVLEVETVREHRDKIELKFTVSDTGIGIPKSIQKKLFKPFTQADGSTTRMFGGTGLGLAICKNLVELMKGEIGLDSEEGKGSQFWFKLCFEKQKIEPASAEVVSGGEASAEITKFNGRVLVAEDSEVGQEVIRKHLQHLGFYTKVVSNGKEALSHLALDDYDLVILDCHMPVLNGFETTAQIRNLAEASKSQIPIIALTADACDASEQNCLDAGMDAYLTKPFTQKALREVLEKNYKKTV